MLPQVSLACALLLAAFPGGVTRTASLRAAYTPATAGTQAKLGERFKLFSGESASIEDTELSLTLTRVLRSWSAKGKGESVNVDFTSILHGKERQHSFRRANSQR